MRRRLLLLLGLAAVAAVAAVVALASSGSRNDAAPVATAKAEAAAAAVDDLPLRNTRARAVEPVAGESAATAALPLQQPADPAPRGTSTPAKPRMYNSGPSDDAAISGAEVLKNGIALPPIEAPQPVRQIIEAGNAIARTPYLWGGGHGKWLDKGYDCSGSISFALASAGLLGGPLDSGRLMGWGKAGKGKWVTIYSNPGHVFMVVAGVRFDTSGTRASGSRWQSAMRATGGYVARHPTGL